MTNTNNTASINNFCTACGQSIHLTATSCPHCGAHQGGDTSTPLITAQSDSYTSQTHLFLVTDSLFKVRWTYWVWWALAVVSFLAPGKSYLFGSAVMPYLFVSALIKRKQWQHQQLLTAIKSNKSNDKP